MSTFLTKAEKTCARAIQKSASLVKPQFSEDNGRTWTRPEGSTTSNWPNKVSFFFLTQNCLRPRKIPSRVATAYFCRRKFWDQRTNKGKNAIHVLCTRCQRESQENDASRTKERHHARSRQNVAPNKKRKGKPECLLTNGGERSWEI